MASQARSARSPSFKASLGATKTKASTSRHQSSSPQALAHLDGHLSPHNLSKVNPKDAVVISRSDLLNIQGTATNPLRLASSSRLDSTQRQAPDQSDRGRSRKERILAMEQEKLRSKAALTEMEEEEKLQRDLTLAKAKRQMDEENDDVKHMATMVNYAKCVTIRDAQILEKRRLQEDGLFEEKAEDLKMELARMRLIQDEEIRNRQRAEERKIGATVLIKQMEERQQERIRAQELKEQEAQAMLQRIRDLEIKEQNEREAKVMAERTLLKQVMEANNAQARAKLRKKQEEIEEDARIAEYIRQRDLREQELEAQQNALKQEKEREVARLRSMQERALDRQSQIDELRAKRYQEQKDRQWRKAEMEQASRREQMKDEIAQARELQRAEKSRRMLEQALQERQEYDRVLEWQRTQNDIDHRRRDDQEYRKLQHREDLQGQISLHEREKAEARQRFLAEGQAITKQLEMEKRKIARIKDEMLGELEKLGVPEKYRTELVKKKIAQSSIHGPR